MRKKIRPAVIIIILHLLGISLWMFLTPETSNIKWGDPGAQELMQTCDTEDKAVEFKLYEGIKGNEWSVTAKVLKLPEKQFFYSAGNPRIDSLVCRNSVIKLYSGGKIYKDYSYSRAVKLTDDPDGFENGERLSGFFSEPFGFKRIAGLIGLLLTLFFIWVIIIESKD